MAQALHRVLIVDDNRSIHDDMKKILKPVLANQLAAVEAELFGEDAPTVPTASPDPDFEVESAYQGQEALKLVADAVQAGRPFSVAFVDVRMPPGWDGVETVQRLWEIDPALEIVICTAYSDYSWQEIVAKLGHTDRFLILKKPFHGIEVRQLAMTLSEKATLRSAQERQLAELQKALAAAEQANQAKSEFLANMSPPAPDHVRALRPKATRPAAARRAAGTSRRRRTRSPGRATAGAGSGRWAGGRERWTWRRADERAETASCGAQRSCCSARSGIIREGA